MSKFCTHSTECVGPIYSCMGVDINFLCRNEANMHKYKTFKQKYGIPRMTESKRTETRCRNECTCICKYNMHIYKDVNLLHMH